MNNLLFLIGLLAFAVSNTSCGKGVYNVPEEFAPYVNSFQDEARKYGYKIEETELEVKFADNLGYQVAGDCSSVEGVPTIRISLPFWEYHKDTFTRELLMYHELGHCWLSKGHVHPPNWAIMNPNMLTTSYYKMYRDILVAALFQ